MSEAIKIRKGLDISLKGKAEKVIIKSNLAGNYAVKPTDFPGLTPKLTIDAGDTVKAGSILFTDKFNTDIQFTSPVSGKVIEIKRGERRKILEVVIESDGQNNFEQFKQADPISLEKKEIIENLLRCGLWPSIKQRPYGIIANPADTPKAIFISCFDSAPLGVDYDFVLQDNARELQTGIDALSKITSGKVHIGVNGSYPVSSVFANLKNVQINKFIGKHPAGNVGVQIHNIDPINKGEIVWTIDPQSVAIIGRLFLTGHYDATKIIALAGSEVLKPRYYKAIAGCNISTFIKDNIKGDNPRFISGNVLTGTSIDAAGYLGFYDSMFAVIPEGNHHEFMGWLAPGFNKFSLSHSFFSWLNRKKEYTIDTNIRGGKRALMITGNYEKVFPFNIYPMQLLKAIIIGDIELMEKLGIYEVIEEDFALCEFIDTSKTDIQAIVRKGIETMIKEMN